MDQGEQLIAAVRRALDQPLLRHGFAGGQGGSGDGGQVQVVFCCPEDDFRAQHPSVLPERQETGPWGCVDLLVDVDGTAPPRLREVRLETEPLAALLARRGKLAAADESRHLGRAPIEQALDRLSRLVLDALDA